MKQNKSSCSILWVLAFFGCQSAGHFKPVSELPVEPVIIKKEKVPNPEGLRHFMDGQLLMSQGDFAMAIIEFQQALELDPNVGAIHTAIAECYWNLGKSDLSEKHLSIAIKADPDDEQALQMYADQMILQKKYEAARIPFEKLNTLNPDEPKYLIAMAELAKVREDYTTAIALYMKAFELAPERLELLETAGRFAIRSDQEGKAKHIYKRLAELDPDQPRFLAMYIDLVSREKAFDEGESSIQSLNEKYGNSAERNAQLGLLMYRKGDRDKALDLLESALESVPGNPNYYFSLFDIYMDGDQLVKAAELGDRLIANFPEDWRGYYSRALIFMEEKKPQAVIELLAPVVDTFEKVFSVQYLLGISHGQLKQYESAERFYLNALTVRPESKNVKHSLAIMYDEMHEFGKSDRIYFELIQSDSLDAQALNNFAYSLVERNIDLERALTLAKRAIAIEPENASYLDTIGWIYFKLDELKIARAYIEASVKIADTNAVVLEHLGDILMKINQPMDAKDFYRRALELDQNNERLRLKVKVGSE